MFVEGRNVYCKRKTIYLVLLLVTQICSAVLNSGVATNLTATVFEDTTFVEKNEEHGPLKLNITWKPPLNSRKPSSYSVLITSLPKPDDAGAKSCPEETLFSTTWDGNRCYAVLPENQFSSELSIRPTCSYVIQVYANPRSNPKLKAPEIILNVPECVGRWCSCEDAQKTLPVPEVNVVSENQQNIRIEWKVKPVDTRVHSYVISFGVPFLTSNSQLAVYNITKIANVSSTVSSYLWSINNTDLDITSGGKVFVTSQDVLGCLGTSGTALMDLPIEPLASVHHPVHEEKINYELKFQWLVWVCLVGLSMVLLGTAISLLYVRNQKKYQLIWGNQRAASRIQGLVGLSRLRSQWADATLREHNVLYVEQEVQDAINRGDADEFEVSFKRLKFIRELGKGQFGKVYLGTLEGHGDSAVAIKMSNCPDPSTEPQARQQFLAEIETMKNAGPHPHLVKLVATCTLPEKPICLILEYLEGGDLLAHLHRLRDCLICDGDEVFDSGVSSSRSQRPSLSETVYTTLDNQSPTLGAFPDYPTKISCTDDGKENGQLYVNIAEDDSTDASDGCNEVDRCRFTSFALDIARGMEHLESRGIIHRDLAARNILLSTDMRLKISDFGLSRNDGVYIIGTTEGVRRLPVRWMAPEALRDRAFTSKSDVWSFAIVLWEIGTLGAFPYYDIQDDQVLRHVLRDEGRLQKPNSVSVELYDIMRSCWASRPENRPNFGQIVQRLLALDEPSKIFNATSNPCYSLFPTMPLDEDAAFAK